MKKLFEYAGHDYWITDAGYIECRECSDFWCTHIQLLVSTGGDMGTIWPEAIADLSDRTVMVPIVPTVGQWCRVELAYNDRVLAYKVHMSEVKSSHFLGFISPGEARMTLRSMIVDWFRGNVNTDHLECQQTGHSFQAEVRWQRDMKDPATSFGQHWSVWASEKCLGCAGASDDFDDLVPDDDKQPSVWGKK